MKEKELAGIPVLIFANKQDLVQALQPDEVVKRLYRSYRRWRWRKSRQENGLLRLVRLKLKKDSKMDWAGLSKMSKNDKKTV